MGEDIGVPLAWPRPGFWCLGSMSVSRCCGTVAVIMKLLAADVVLNLLSLTITSTYGHQSLLSRLSSPNSLCIVVRKSIHIRISKHSQMNARGE